MRYFVWRWEQGEKRNTTTEEFSLYIQGVIQIT